MMKFVTVMSVDERRQVVPKADEICDGDERRRLWFRCRKLQKTENDKVCFHLPANTNKIFKMV